MFEAGFDKLSPNGKLILHRARANGGKFQPKDLGEAGYQQVGIGLFRTPISPKLVEINRLELYAFAVKH